MSFLVGAKTLPPAFQAYKYHHYACTKANGDSLRAVIDVGGQWTVVLRKSRTSGNESESFILPSLHSQGGTACVVFSRAVIPKLWAWAHWWALTGPKKLS